MTELTRPIVGIENRTAQEVFDIMCDRIKRADPAALSLPQPNQIENDGEAVGEAGSMPGTDGFTMAVFKASDVPIGTKLFTHPPELTIDEAAALLQQQKEEIERLREALAPFALRSEIVAEQDGNTPSKHAMVGTDHLHRARAALEAQP